MADCDDYQLLDFGGGRKLERFGALTVDRPAPAADELEPRDADLWERADARYLRRDAQAGTWSPLIDPWTIHRDSFVVELRPTDAGQLGIFPEQADNWRWIAEQVRRRGPIKVLNLFAYTGLSTLAAAAAGAQVVHVDAAAGSVAWARRNAEISGLADAPIRWITEDAPTFARRELKRGNRYDAVILDPPAYGHGPKGQSWKLADNLPELLTTCLELLADRGSFLLLSCHTGDLAFAGQLHSYLIAHAPRLSQDGTLSGQDMLLRDLGGRTLHAGAAVRWSNR